MNLLEKYVAYILTENIYSLIESDFVFSSASSISTQEHSFPLPKKYMLGSV